MTLKVKKTVCEEDQCYGCSACIEKCPHDAIKLEDSLKSFNAYIDETKCINCGLCHRLCPRENEKQLKEPTKWYQGWASDEEVRAISSSGGVAQALARAFTREGGLVCSCVYRGGKYGFKFLTNEDDIAQIAGSKYVKSDAADIYRELEKYLTDGKKVLIIALPCQIQSVKRFVNESLHDRLYTIDLICHGTPSPKLLTHYLKQHGIDQNDVKVMEFRRKNNKQIYYDDKTISSRGTSDRYTIAFFNKIIQMECCYSCEYASTERGTDITLGDSWGSELPKEQILKGVSLVLCNTKRGLEILEKADLELKSVNIQNAILNNDQLRGPIERPDAREAFFKKVKNEDFDKLVFRYFYKECIKQIIKKYVKAN